MKYLKLMGVAFLLVGIVLFLEFYGVKEKGSQQIEHYKKLEKENDVLSVKNDSLGKKLIQLNRSSDSLQQVIYYSDTLLEKNQQKKDEEINTIQSFSDVELFEFFSEFDTKSSVD